MRRIRQLIWISCRLFLPLLGAGLLGYMVFRTGPGVVWKQVQVVGWGFSLIIVLGGLSQLIRTCAWRQTITYDIKGLRWSRSIGAQLASDACGQLGFAGKMVGEGIRVSLLSPVVPADRGISSCAIDGGLHLLTAAVVAVLGISITLLHFPLSGQWRVYALLLAAVLIALVVLAAVAVASRWRLMGNAARAIGRLPQLHNWVIGKEPTIDSAEHNLLTFSRKAPAAFWASLIFSLLWHALAVLEVYVILRFMGAGIAFVGAFALEGLTKVINLVGALNPGNVGTYEGGNMLIAKMFGVTATAGLTLALCRRACSIFWAAIGAVCMIMMKRTEWGKTESRRSPMRGISYITLPVVLLLLPTLIQADTLDEPYKFFREFAGLNEEQIAAIRSGKAVAKVVESPTPDEVYVFGSVYVEATPESYLKLASDIDALRKLPSYLAIQSFSDPPQLSDLEGFTLDEQDISELKNCKPGHCQLQLPIEAIEDFQQSINWSAPDVADQVNRLARRLALQALLEYMQGGNTALGAYRDKKHPAAVAETFASLITRLSALPVYLPELNEYLLEYPKANSDNLQAGFYWEEVNFGLKPTFRIVQRIVYRGVSPTDPAYAVAEKQIYASHYFEAALDLTVCVKDAQRPGFYIITVKGSTQAGLTGLKGNIVRKVAVDKTRSSLERVLVTMKQKLESQHSQGDWSLP